jgi:hypothetical protein
VRTHVVLLAVALVALFAMTAAAADVSGNWIAQIPGRQGATTETTFTFKAEGAKLTGSVTNQMGEQAISEGQVSGDDISFATITKRNEMEIKMVYKGKVAGNEIQFTRTREGGGAPGGGAPGGGAPSGAAPGGGAPGGGAPGGGAPGGGGGGMGGPTTFVAKRAS